MSKRINMRRIPRTLSWDFEAGEQFTRLATQNATYWMNWECERKGKIYGGLLNKATGILVELTFRAILDELKVPHTATESFLHKFHPVNAGKIYDFRLADGTTIDLKAAPPCNPRRRLNVNQYEVTHSEICDYYVLYNLSGNYTNTELFNMGAADKNSVTLGEKLWNPKISEEEREKEHEKTLPEFVKVMEKLRGYILDIKHMKFIGYAKGEELVKRDNLVEDGPFGSYYCLDVPEKEMVQQDFAREVLHIAL